MLSKPVGGPDTLTPSIFGRDRFTKRNKITTLKTRKFGKINLKSLSTKDHYNSATIFNFFAFFGVILGPR